ncbi:MAG: RIP metalloprotease RseP [Planctomycetota bacterium]
MTEQIGYWVLVVLGFGFLIFVHELGHFIAAKLMGIRVIRFAFGFGPRLFGTNKYADAEEEEKRVEKTDYCVRLIPCGGYVKMAGGEIAESEEATGAEDEFPSKTPGQRAFVVIAGPAMSILSAIPLLAFVFLSGMERPGSRVNHVKPGAPAWGTRMRRGDLITGIKKQGEKRFQRIWLWRQVQMNSIIQDEVGDIVLRIERDGRQMTLDLTTDEEGHIGIVPGIVGKGRGFITTAAGYRPDDSPANDAGIVPGARILRIADTNVHTWWDFERTVFRHPGQTVPVQFETPDGERKTSDLAIGEQTYWSLGIVASRPNRIGMVRPDFPAEQAGLQPGDRILQVDGRPVRNWPELAQQVVNAAPGEVALTVRQNGTEGEDAETVRVTLEEGAEIGDVLGIAREEHPVVEGFLEGAPAEAVIEVGSTLVKWRPVKDGEPRDFKRWPDPVHLIPLEDYEEDKAPGRYEVTVELDGQTTAVAVAPVKATRGQLELDPRLHMTRTVEPGRPIAAVKQAVIETGQWISLAARSLYMLVTAQLSMDMLAGPVMIVTATRYRAEAGFMMFVEFLVMVTVSLGIINLVPFPILDGGHVLFLLIEKIRGRPLPERVMGFLMYAGMVALLALMVFVTVNDIVTLGGI